ncbi:hypothetical protein Q9L58_010218 [Maublancomyces gigas]|uniref:G domain-containing protein n=1 Tax=Discina gigas TaxID=1032678 RepID=A0ABR3G4S5_9PEZI
MGVTGAGKSNFIKTLTGDENIVVGKRLKSCTKRVHESLTFRLGEDTIQMVDTPGFNDDMISDDSTLGLIAKWMMNIPDTQKLGGILYFHRITDTRMDGGALRCVKLFEDICGPTFLQNTALITTMWDKYPEDFHETVETERELINQYWHPCLTVCQSQDGAGFVKILFDSSNSVVRLDTDITGRGSFTGAMYARSDNTKEMFEKILREIIRKRPVIPELQKELAREASLEKTTAGKRLRKALDKGKPRTQRMEGNGLEGEAAPAEPKSDIQLFRARSRRMSEKFTKQKWSWRRAAT